LRLFARALTLGTLAALVIDAALRNALAAAQTPGVSGMTPWWVVGHVEQRAVWVIVALIIWGTAQILSRQLALHAAMANDRRFSRTAAFGLAGKLLIILPLVWVVAAVTALIVRLTLTAAWPTEGQIFTSSQFYNQLLLGYVPWAGGGIIVVTVSRHISD
jgi:hypothetical protein